MSGGAGASDVCARPGCGRPVGTQTTTWRQRRLYCQPECRNRANTERQKAKKAPYVPPTYQRVCQYPACGKAFTSPTRDAKFCTHTCSVRLRDEQQRARIDVARRDAAARTAARRARRETCPDCGAPLGADLTLLYCGARCGWSELLTAHKRDPRATPTETTMAKETSQKPDADEPEEEEEELEDEDEDEDEDEEEEEDEEPPARKGRRKPLVRGKRGAAVKRIVALVAERPGLTYPEIRKSLDLPSSTASGSLQRAVKAGQVERRGEQFYPGKSKAPKAPAPPAPKAAPPAPATARTPFLAARVLIASLPADQLDLLLDKLAPLAEARAAVRIAARVYEEARAKLAAEL